MSYVSILHEPGDEMIASRVAEALMREGSDAHMLRSDDDIASDADVEARPCVILWTPRASSIGAPAILQLACAAMARGTLIPISVAGARLPAELRALPPADLTGWMGDTRDPRWRFVAEEVSLAAQRTMLEGSDAWAASEAEEEKRERELASGLSEGKAGAVAPQTTDDAPTPERETSFEQDAPEAPAESDHVENEPVGNKNEREEAWLLSAERADSSSPIPSPLKAGNLRIPLALAASASVVVLTIFAALAAVLFLSPGVRDEAPAVVAAIDEPAPTPAQLSVINAAAIEAPADEAAPTRENETTLAFSEAPADQAEELTPPDLRDAGWALEPASGGSASVGSSSGVSTPSADNASQDLSSLTGVVQPQLAALGGQAALPVETIAVSADNHQDADGLDASLLFNDETYLRDCPSCPPVARVPGGRFVLGSPESERARTMEEGPAILVDIPRPFAIAAHEISVDQWAACVADGGCGGYVSPVQGPGAMPVVGVSFDDAQAYVRWLSAKTGHDYRLPSEAEWEYAARAGTNGPFSFGAILTPDAANYDAAYAYGGPAAAPIGRPVRVASFDANGFGLYDMHGNVWEWTADCWAPGHAGAAADGAARTAIEGGDCARRVMKGGSWNSGGWRLRAAHRIGKPASLREDDNGFRVVRDLE